MSTHVYALVRAHGEAGWTGRTEPLTLEGLIYASSMVILDAARRKTPIPALARLLLGPGIAATLAANVAHGWGTDMFERRAAWPTVALVGSYELLMMVICGSQALPDGVSGGTSIPDPLSGEAVEALEAVGVTR